MGARLRNGRAFSIFDVGFREEMEEGEQRFVVSETGREGSGMREEAS